MDAAGLTIALINLCGKLYTAAKCIKDAPETARRLGEGLLALERTLKSVDSAMKGSVVLDMLKTDIVLCFGNLEKLNTKINGGRRDMLRSLVNRFKWPLSESETREYLEQIERLKATLAIELQAHSTYVRTSDSILAEYNKVLTTFAEPLPRRRQIGRRPSVRSSRWSVRSRRRNERMRRRSV